MKSIIANGTLNAFNLYCNKAQTGCFIFIKVLLLLEKLFLTVNVLDKTQCVNNVLHHPLQSLER